MTTHRVRQELPVNICSRRRYSVCSTSIHHLHAAEEGEIEDPHEDGEPGSKRRKLEVRSALHSLIRLLNYSAVFIFTCPARQTLGFRASRRGSVEEFMILG